MGRSGQYGRFDSGAEMSEEKEQMPTSLLHSTEPC